MTYLGQLECKDIWVINFFKVLLFPHGCGIFADSLFLWEFDISQRPICRYFCNIAQKDLDPACPINIANWEFDLVLGLIIL